MLQVVATGADNPLAATTGAYFAQNGKIRVWEWRKLISFRPKFCTWSPSPFPIANWVLLFEQATTSLNWSRCFTPTPKCSIVSCTFSIATCVCRRILSFFSLSFSSYKRMPFNKCFELTSPAFEDGQWSFSVHICTLCTCLDTGCSSESDPRSPCITMNLNYTYCTFNILIAHQYVNIETVETTSCTSNITTLGGRLFHYRRRDIKHLAILGNESESKPIIKQLHRNTTRFCRLIYTMRS